MHTQKERDVIHEKSGTHLSSVGGLDAVHLGFAMLCNGTTMTVSGVWP